MAGRNTDVDLPLLQRVMALAVAAGEAILPFYDAGRQVRVERKADQSPVTEADYAADRLLKAELPSVLPIPVLSEESEIPSFAERAAWARYWLVDPLDGTREFLAGSGEFAVNIALIVDGEPILGVVYAPASGTGYGGLKGRGAFRYEDDRYQLIRGRSMSARREAGEPLTLVASRRHGTELLAQVRAALARQFGDVVVRPLGSSLKQCRVAEGFADLSLQYWPTSEWDTAAGQVVVEAAGGMLVDTHFRPLRYNRTPSLLNPSFYVIADRTFDWEAALRPLAGMRVLK